MTLYPPHAHPDRSALTTDPDFDHHEPSARTIALQSFRRAGRTAAEAMTPARGAASRRTARQRIADVHRGLQAAIAMPDVLVNQEWLTDNIRLLTAAERDAREFCEMVRRYPATARGTATLPRVAALAETYLDIVGGQYDEDSFASFMTGAQQARDLLMNEIWASKPALLLAILERLATAATTRRYEIPELVTSVRRLSEGSWKEIFEAVNVVDRMLGLDPAGAYGNMDYESRDIYREVVARIAKRSSRSEGDVAAAAIRLAAESHDDTLTPVAAQRRKHVGYYLVDAGLPALKQRIDYRPTLVDRVGTVMARNPFLFFMGGIAGVTIALVAWLAGNITSPVAAAISAVLLLIPVSQVAVEFVNNFVSAFVKPSRLPKLDFSTRIPDDCATLVAVPALLLSESHVHELVMDLEIRYLANRDPNLSFALLTDAPDSLTGHEERDDLVRTCEGLLRDLNRRYGAPGRTPFYLFHRYRHFNASEGRWMGWERKRGKLLDLNRLLRGGPDRFPIKVGDRQALSRVRYVLTLDADTQLPRDAAHKMIGAIAHPLNRAVIDPVSRRVVEGYGILQPRIGISTLSASRSWLAHLLSGETGFDIYTRAVSDVYQDLFGEGSFTGKGIYDVDAFRDSLEERFPENALLSHDLVEGLFARAGLVSDVELIDDYPTHFSAYSKRKHRWMRGDWQILRWLTANVPDGKGRLIENQLNPLARWKILDNLRRSLFEPATLLLLLGGWFVLPGSARDWTLVSVALLIFPAYAQLFFSVFNPPTTKKEAKIWVKDRARAFGHTHLLAALHLAFLLHDALLALDAVVRSLARVFVTRRKLLEWETAAEAEARSRPKGAADAYLEWSPLGAGVLALLMTAVVPSALPAAAPVLAMWMLAGVLATWLGLAPRSVRLNLGDADVQNLRTNGLRMWRYFREFGSERSNWLVPDNVRADGTVAARLSPTNLGFLLNARIAAVHLGFLTVREFVDATERTLDAAQKLPMHRGHFYNWVDTETLQTLEPRFVSTVDSGNLAACLWTLKQAAAGLTREGPNEIALWNGIRDIARLVGEGTDPGAQALANNVLQVSDDWKAALPELGDLARHYAETASGDSAWWARELVSRLDEARAWLAEGLTPELRQRLEGIGAVCDRMVTDMDFSFLYDGRKKMLSIGYDTGTGRLEKATYDLLASEARIASFVSIAKGDVPQDAWFHLGRSHVLARGERVLASWTGTMFEYMMPLLWMRHYPKTIIYDSLRAVVRLQQQYTRWRNIPWGISESGCIGPEPSHYGYAAFGLPELAHKRMDGNKTLIISPYSTFLALQVDARAALANIRRMERLGWSGEYGPYEAVDFTSETPTVIRSWMVHHQGMSLLAITNLLCGHVLQNYFHAEPQVLATELLLHERVPHASLSDAEENRVAMPVAEESVA